MTPSESGHDTKGRSTSYSCNVMLLRNCATEGSKIPVLCMYGFETPVFLLCFKVVTKPRLQNDQFKPAKNISVKVVLHGAR